MKQINKSHDILKQKLKYKLPLTDNFTCHTGKVKHYEQISAQNKYHFSFAYIPTK